MLICVDGSGPSSDSEYRAEFSGDFLGQIQAHSTQAFTQRYMGPNMYGLRQVPAADLVQQIRTRYDAGADDAADSTVFLAGYSRGAAMAAHVAALLEPMGIEVEAMFLFDAVDRSPLIGDALPTDNVDIITRNVLHTYHARRDPRAQSRASFGVTASRPTAPGTYEESFFMTTHGGMGGCPFGYTGLESGRWSLGDEYASPATTAARREWISRHGLIWEAGMEPLGAMLTGELSDGITALTMAQEEAGSSQCIRWMWTRLLRHGVVRGASTPHVVTRRGEFDERY